jgi:hypothetical protein
MYLFRGHKGVNIGYHMINSKIFFYTTNVDFRNVFRYWFNKTGTKWSHRGKCYVMCHVLSFAIAT